MERGRASHGDSHVRREEEGGREKRESHGK